MLHMMARMSAAGTSGTRTPVGLSRVWALGTLLLVAGCGESLPAPMRLEDVGGWKATSSATLGVGLDVPDSWETATQGADLRFDRAGHTVLRITWVTAAEARRRGLWATSDPVGPIEVAGVEGQLYRYRHYDGPFYVPTIAYVVPHRGRFLGLEFRTARAGIDPVERRVLESVRLTDDGL